MRKQVLLTACLTAVAVIAGVGIHALLRDIEGRPLVLVAGLAVGCALGALVFLTLLNRTWRTQATGFREWLDQRHRISRLAGLDALTGPLNRVHLQRLLHRLLLRASRDRTRLALLCVDLDRSTSVNDAPDVNRLGQGSEDKLLTIIAGRLRASVAAHDVVVRMGGDEFVVIATLLPEADAVNSIADRIRTVLQTPVDVDGVTLSITPNIGISVFPEDGSDPEQLLKHAEIALSQRKGRAAGNRQFDTPEIGVLIEPSDLGRGVSRETLAAAQAAQSGAAEAATAQSDDLKFAGPRAARSGPERES